MGPPLRSWPCAIREVMRCSSAGLQEGFGSAGVLPAAVVAGLVDTHAPPYRWRRQIDAKRSTARSLFSQI